MKKLLYAFMALFLTGVGLTACGDDDEGDDANYSYTQAADQDAAGTFVGTFTRIQTNLADAEEESAEGTLTISPLGSNQAQIALSSDDFKLVDTVVVNATHANGGISLYNHTVYYTVKTPAGSIREGGDINFGFDITQKISVRVSRPYRYTFIGRRQ